MKRIFSLGMAIAMTGAAQAAFITTNAVENAVIRGLGTETNNVQAFGTTLSVKQGASGGTGTRIGLLKLDLSGIGAGDVTAASVKLAPRVDSQDWNLYVFAVKESVEQSWDPATATWASVEAGGMFTPTHGLYTTADPNLTLIGSVPMLAGTVGEYPVMELASQALVEALNADANGEMTLVLCSDESVLNVSVKSLNADESLHPSLSYSTNPGDASTEIQLQSTSLSITNAGAVSLAPSKGAPAFNIGDTVRLSWDMELVGTPTYATSANWSWGIVDSTQHGAAFSIRLNGAALWSASVDSSVAGPGALTANLSSDYRATASAAVADSAFDLKQDGEAAKFELNVTKNTATEYIFLAHWKNPDGVILDTLSRTNDLSVEIEDISYIAFANRSTTGSVTGNTTNVTLEMNPVVEPVAAFQIGGDSAERDAGWSAATNLNDYTLQYIHTDTTDPDLTFTITATAGNTQDLLVPSSNFIKVDSSARQTDTHTARLTDDETVTLTLEVTDPNNSLSSLLMSGLGVIWNTGSSETTTVTDASANVYAFGAFPNDTFIQGNYSELGLDAWTTAGWSVTFAVANPGTSSGPGGFAFQYQVSTNSVATDSYDTWAAGNGLTPGVNDGLLDDAENGGIGDGLNNLLEYALGGNPLVDDASSVLPKQITDGSVLKYIYKRPNPVDPTLTYTVLDGTDLVNSGLNNTNTSETVSAVVDGYETVTNEVSTVIESRQFMQLKVQKD